MHTHYDNLKVSRDAPPEVIRAAYKSLSQKYHPDRHADGEEANRIMRLLNAAYDVLRDPGKRAEHDQWIVAQEKLEADQKLRRAQAQRTAAAAQAHQQRQAAQRQQAQRAAPQPPPPPPEPEFRTRPAREPRAARPRKPRRFWRETPPQEGPAAPLPKYGSLALYAGIGALIVVLLGDWSSDATAGRNTAAPEAAQSLSALPSLASIAHAVTPAPARESKYVRPSLTPRGLPWPAQSGYLPGYPVLNDSGLSTLTVDNSSSRSDVLLKLVAVDGNTPLPVRTSFVRSGATFTMDAISPGSYDLRYQSLDTGELFRSERFDLTELKEAGGGTSANRNVFRLYGVPGGTSRSVPISEREFP
ncbi:DnaJ-like protein [Cupriavidus agavae]|uniref:DnaJ-like protein n=2 Tax=Cupriavidus agavae TaxID=1001822 RepID=A0A4Q7S775_9BURK|nr:DnaJ-like protein [Cupriavidus agavae]